MKKRPLFYSIWQKWRWWHLAFRDCKKEIDDCNFWSTVQIQLSHIKNFQEQHSSVVIVKPQGGLILLREVLAKIEKYWGSEQILWQGWTRFFATLCRLNFYDPVQNFNANIANYQVGLGIEFFAIHFPWKEADRKRNLTSVSIPKTNCMNHEFRPKITVFLSNFLNSKQEKREQYLYEHFCVLN